MSLRQVKTDEIRRKKRRGPLRTPAQLCGATETQTYRAVVARFAVALAFAAVFLLAAGLLLAAGFFLADAFFLATAFFLSLIHI